MRIEKHKRIGTAISLILIEMVAFMSCQSASLAISPKEDFVKWHRDWWDRMPKNYTLSYKEFFNREKPLLLTYEYWGDSDCRLCVTSDSRAPNKEYRLLLNPKYAAAIEGYNRPDSIWHVTQFGLRGDDNFPSFTSRFDATAELLGTRTIFDQPYSVNVKDSIADKGRTRRIIYSFAKRAKPKARDPKEFTVTLDEASDWLPIEIAKSEFGGIKSRVEIDGWHRSGDRELFRNVTTFVQMPGAEKETLHSVQSWEFTASPIADRRAECFLDFYGLPEPSVASWAWRAIIFVIAVVVTVIGYILIRLR